MKEITEWKLFPLKQMLIVLIGPVNVEGNEMNSDRPLFGDFFSFHSHSLCQFPVPALKWHTCCRLWAINTVTKTLPWHRIYNKEKKIQHQDVSPLSLRQRALQGLRLHNSESVWASVKGHNSASHSCLSLFKVETIQKRHIASLRSVQRELHFVVNPIPQMLLSFFSKKLFPLRNILPLPFLMCCSFAKFLFLSFFFFFFPPIFFF